MKRQWNLVVGIVAFAAAAGCGGTDTTLGGHEDVEPGVGEGSGGGATSNGQLHDGQVGGTNTVEPVWSDAAREARLEAVVSVVGQEMAHRLHTFTPRHNVYSVKDRAGAAFTWLELAPGQALVSVVGEGAPSVPLEQLREYRTASELFLAIAPDLPVPSELEDLDARYVEMRPVYEKLAQSAELFPQFQRVPGLNEHAGATLDEGAVQQIALPALGDGFGQLGSALDGASCLDFASGCGSIPSSGPDWSFTQNLRTSNSSFSRDDQDHVFGIGCAQAGTITYRVRYDAGWFYEEHVWFAHDLTAPSWVGYWDLSLDQGTTDFWFKAELYNFHAGDKAAQCGYGYE